MPRRRTRPLGPFLRGLATLLPVFLTIWVFLTLFDFARDYVVEPINSGLYWGLERNEVGWRSLREMGVEPYDPSFLDKELLPDELEDVGLSEGWASPAFRDAVRAHREAHEGWFKDLDALLVDDEHLHAAVTAQVPPPVGLGVALLLVAVLGWLVGGFLGRRLVGRLEAAFVQLPGVRSVYPYAKRFVDFFLTENQLEFESVVAVPYPSKGLWSVAFVTSSSFRTLREATGKELVSVFVPSSPMPMTGYTIHVAPEDVVPLPISVDDALASTVTGGVLVPEGQDAGPLPERLLSALAPERTLAGSADDERDAA